VLRAYAATLVTEENQIGPAAHSEFGEKIRHVKFHGALGYVQAVSHFFVGQVLEKAGEDLLLAPAEFVRGVHAQAAPLRGA